MAKKNGSGSRSKNDNLRGGKNTLPKKTDGTVDIKKVVKEGAQEQKKKWVDKKVVKDRKPPKQVLASLKKDSTTKSQQTNKGITRLKVSASITRKPPMKIQKKEINNTKGISKLKIATPKKVNTPKKAPVKKAPTKGR